jgi:hypothetical protein
LVQTPATSIDGFIEIWLINATNSSLYDIVSPFGGDYDGDPYFFTGSTIDNAFNKASFAYGSNTWYHLVLACAPGQNIRASILSDDGTELIGQTLAHGAEAYGSGFQIALSQVIGGSGAVYPVDVAVDYARLNNGAPVLTAEPTNQVVMVGGTASFSVSVAGLTPLSYQWSFNGLNLTNATNAILTLANIQTNQAGNYAVSVSNAVGTTNSISAALNVVAPPFLTQATPPALQSSRKNANRPMQLSWPVVSGAFQVQTAESPLGPWTTIAVPIITNGVNAIAILPSTNEHQYFRLRAE